MPLADTAKKRLLTAIKLLIFLAVAWFVWSTLAKAVADLRQHTFEIHAGWLVVAVLAYVAGLVPNALFYDAILRGAQQHPPFWRLIRAWFGSQFGKYVPGKALVIVLRTALLGNRGAEPAVAAAAVFTEVLSMMACGSALSLAILLWVWGPQLSNDVRAISSLGSAWTFVQSDRGIMLGLALVMALGTGLPTYPPIMRFAMNLLGVGKVSPTAAEKLHGVPGITFAYGWLLIAIGWTLQGLGLTAVLWGLGEREASPGGIAMNVATVAMSTVAGFLSLIPGGLGVREMVQMELMNARYEPATALVATAVWRVLTIVADLGLSTMLYEWRRKPDQTDANSATASKLGR